MKKLNKDKFVTRLKNSKCDNTCQFKCDKIQKLKCKKSKCDKTPKIKM